MKFIILVYTILFLFNKVMNKHKEQQSSQIARTHKPVSIKPSATVDNNIKHSNGSEPTITPSTTNSSKVNPKFG